MTPSRTQSAGHFFQRIFPVSSWVALMILQACSQGHTTLNVDSNASVHSPHTAAIVSPINQNFESTLTKLEQFTEPKLPRTTTDLPSLKQRMDQLLDELEALATSDNVSFAPDILEKTKSVRLAALKNSQSQNDERLIGLWLHWAERILLSRSALQHYFSEQTLNAFESKLDQNSADEALLLLPQLKAVFHPTHEARLVSIYRAHADDQKVAGPILQSLAASGGPLARLFIYQRFSANPTEEFAEALARAGFPRTSDLLGEDSLLQQGPFFFERSRESAVLKNVLSTARDFPDRWKEMKSYLESLRNIPEKLKKARDFWRQMHAETAQKIDALDISTAQKQSLKGRILQSFGSNKRPEQFTYLRDGLSLQEGDIILIQAGETGGLWETFTQSGSLLSHLQMVTFSDDGLPYSIEMNFGQILVAPLDLKAERFAVLRPQKSDPAVRKRIHDAFALLANKNVSYDFKFDSQQHESLYCSELAAAVLKEAKVAANPKAFAPASERAEELLRKSGIPSRLFFAQGSYLGSSDFTLVGERVYANPGDLIRGEMILNAFTQHLTAASSVRLRSHPDAATVYGLSTLAQTLGPDLRRGLGPQPFLFTVMILDRLLRSIEDDVRSAQAQSNALSNSNRSRISQLRQNLSEALAKTIPDQLSLVFPN